MVDVPLVDRVKCDGCGLCISVCKCHVLVLVDNIVTVVRKEECISCKRWCTLCEDVCPTGAISYPFEIIVEERK